MFTTITYVVSLFPVAGLIYGLQQSSAVGKGIVVILFVGSILAWSLMLTKEKTLRQGERMSELFLGAYRKEGNPAALFLKRHRWFRR